MPGRAAAPDALDVQELRDVGEVRLERIEIELRLGELHAVAVGLRVDQREGHCADRNGCDHRRRVGSLLLRHIIAVAAAARP